MKTLTLVDDEGHVSCIDLVGAEEEQESMMRSNCRKRKMSETGPCSKKPKIISSDVCLVDDNGEITNVKLVSTTCDPVKTKKKFVKLLDKMHKSWMEQVHSN